MARTFRVVALLLVCTACGTTTSGAVTPSPSAGGAVAASAPASPVVTPPPDYGPPPAGVDLFYVQLPGSPSWAVGYDWSGAPRATLHFRELDSAADQPYSGLSVAPSGSGFWSLGYTFDRLGRVVADSPAPGKGSANMVWSEDGQVLCGVQETTSDVDQNGNGTADFFLVRRTPSTAPVRVSNLLHLDEIPGDMGLTAYACSNSLNRALIVRTVCCGIQGATVVRLSDGAVLGTWSRGGSGQPVFSPDGQEVADPTWAAGGSTQSTEVRLVLGGTVLARYGSGVAFQAFSANDRFAVVKSGAQVQVIEVATRRVVWRDTQGRVLSRVWARPWSGDMALFFTAPPVQVPCPNSSSSPCTNPLSNAVVVHADGSSVALQGDLIVPVTWGF